LGDVKGVLISDVLPRSTAEAAGFKKGDVLLTVNGASMSSTSETISYLGTQKVGDNFTYELMREKKKIKGKATFKPFPRRAARRY
jgi:S1-C subfamily serine protease